MQYFKHWLAFLTILIVLAAPLLIQAGNASAADETPAGKIINFRGSVRVLADQKEWTSVKRGQAVVPGNVIQTGSDGWVSLILADETLLQLNKDSRFVLKNVAPTAGWIDKSKIAKIGAAVSGSIYNLEKGGVWLRNKNRNTSFEIKTPAVVVGIRGTEVELNVGDDETATLTVLEGKAQAGNEFGKMEVAVREQVVARPKAPLTKRILLTPEDAVQWIIPLPPLFDDRDASPEVKRAFLSLQAGEIKKAQAMMAGWTARRPEESPAWGLYALTAIMLNQKSLALDAAGKAVAMNSRSVNALIIQSYARQMAFDLDGALAATRKALSLDEKNIPALINYARLRFGMDYPDEARKAIETARGLSPENGDVHNLLGFILIAENRTDEAITAFMHAVELDPSLSEPHMGLGIARMRKGEVDAAFEEMSIATLLDPRRSLFLSYWAKMLYQLERFDRALDMLKTARELDPQDPTPELYSAIVLRDLNRPTESIKALNRAIALNDNRAVYRSQFLLDRDLAVKNVDLSILYNQLGLAAWAKNKALSSVKQDYANASGHLFLAGALSEFDDRSWPMQSEFLLARMLMPANVNTFNTFNEYTSFFERPTAGGTLAGSVSDHNGKGTELLTYGAVPKANVAFQTLISYAGNDGWRNTNGEETKNAAALAKWDPTPKDGFMAVASYQKAYQNDIFYPRFEYYPRFNGDKISDPGNRAENEVTRFELGYHRHFSPDSNLLIYAAHLGFSGTFFNKSAFIAPPRIDVLTTADSNRPYYQIQGQYIHKLGSHQFILGTNQYWGENNMTAKYDFFAGTVNFLTTSTINSKNQNLQSYYVQDSWRIAKILTVEGAIYYDHMDNSDAGYGTDWTQNEWGGRFGIIITPTRTDTFRVAAFRYLLPFITSRLDPIDIAGIPVFRNNDEGSLMEEYHAVWEHEWTSGYFSTDIFYLEKKYTHKIIKSGNDEMIDDRGRVTGFELVLNQLLWQGLGLTASYRYQDVNGDKVQVTNREPPLSLTNFNGIPPLPINEREDHLFKVGLKYVHSSGISAGVSEAFLWERFKTTNWQDALTVPAEGRADQKIWLTDARIGYEFPRKKGALNFEMRNIFDNRFNWVTDFFVFKGRAPAREFVLTLSLNF